jgi:DNA repair protein RadC
MAIATVSKPPGRPAAAALPTVGARWKGPGAAVRSRGQLRAGDRRAIDKAMEILAAYMRGPVGDVLSSPDAAKKFACLQLGALPHEVFAVACLDAQNRLIEYQALFRGTLTQTVVYPREVVLFALGAGAASVFLMHNHPSGTLRPSRADEVLTQTLKAALNLIEVRVLDHIIVCGAEALSMAEKGLL